MEKEGDSTGRGITKHLRNLRDTLVWSDAILSSIDELVVVTDDAWKIVYVNDPFTDFAGQQRIFLLGSSLWDKLHVTTDGMSLHEMITKLQLPAEKCSELNGSYIYKEDGSETIFAIHFTYIPKLKQVVLVLRDVTEAALLDAMRNEFINIVSHELRTPLSGIMLYSHMLADGHGGKLTKKQKEFTRSVIESTDRMIELVNTFLSISRIESGRIKLNIQAVDVPRLLQEVIAEHSRKADEQQVTIIEEVDQQLPKAMTDPVLLKEVCTNLVSNAIKYTPENGRVTIAVSVAGKKLVVRVEDSGFGIPKSEHDKVFTRFFRGSNIVSHEVSGTGLGLYLVKLISQALGGHVWFTSAKNKGSTFWFSVPVEAGRQTQASQVKTRKEEDSYGTS